MHRTSSTVNLRGDDDGDTAFIGEKDSFTISDRR
jgi:hypothetical protein